MRLNNKQRWRIIQQYIIGWILAFMFLSIIRGEGTQELGSVQMEIDKALLVSIAAGLIFGALSGYAQILTEEYGYKKISIQKLLVLRLVYVLLFLSSLITLAYLIFAQNISYYNFVFEPGSFAIYLYIIVVDIFMFALRQINLFMGSNNLWKLFRGQFYTPREEERIFMFLDLKSSTTHAERLGHIQYSKLIQDCFNDLGVVMENEAEIYQYVGDEAILTWKLKEGLTRQNCLNAFYNFKNQLNQNATYYSNTYDCIPHFKAGVHAGIVTVTEVGKYKKEIAYHGDTINTAARIQSKCNEVGKELLISEKLKNKLGNNNFGFEQLGSIELKGKKEDVNLYAVNLEDT